MTMSERDREQIDYNRKTIDLEKRVVALEAGREREAYLHLSPRTFQMVEEIRRETSLTAPEILASAVELWKAVNDARRDQLMNDQPYEPEEPTELERFYQDNIIRLRDAGRITDDQAAAAMIPVWTEIRQREMSKRAPADEEQSF